MKLPIYQIDAFAERPFQGNPAAVCPLQHWLPDNILQAIAEENNLAETAFFVESDEAYDLRWFTPTNEVDLCGHATLAAAHVLLNNIHTELSEITFESKSGSLRVFKEGELLTLDFPQQLGVACEPPADLIKGLGKLPCECYAAMDYMVVFENEEAITSLSPDFREFRELDLRGVIATAPGQRSDFVSRFFAPNCGIDEDPVTGSAHCTLTPYWTERLNKRVLIAQQLSKRSGTLQCRVENNRVYISGKTVAYLEGYIQINSEQDSGGNR